LKTGKRAARPVASRIPRSAGTSDPSLVGRERGWHSQQEAEKQECQLRAKAGGRRANFIERGGSHTNICLGYGLFLFCSSGLSEEHFKD
jgi:hypothetical protein